MVRWCCGKDAALLVQGGLCCLYPSVILLVFDLNVHVALGKVNKKDLEGKEAGDTGQRKVLSGFTDGFQLEADH